MSIICKCLFLYELALTILSLVLQDHDALLCVEVIKQCLAPIEGHNNLGRVRVYKGNRGGSAMFWKTDRQWVRGTNRKDKQSKRTRSSPHLSPCWKQTHTVRNYGGPRSAQSHLQSRRPNASGWRSRPNPTPRPHGPTTHCSPRLDLNTFIHIYD